MKTHEIELPLYRNWRPSQFDTKGLGCDDRQDWLVAPCSQTRDSGCLERSNFECMVKRFEALDPSGESFEVHRFGHWGPGWFEIVLVKPGTPVHASAQEVACALESYPVLNDSHHSELEQEEANEVWRECYRVDQRIMYIRQYRSQFEFRSLADLLACVRGKYFAGYASELLG